jgi:hypothetical protein
MIDHVETMPTVDSVNIVRDCLVPGTAAQYQTLVPAVPAALSPYILKKKYEKRVH